MYKLILFFGICSAFASGSTPPEELPAKHPEKHSHTCQETVGCYYKSDLEGMLGATLSMEMIDVSLCTHLFYSLATLGKNASVQVVEADLESEGDGAFQKINNLRKKNRSLKTLIGMEEELSAGDNENIKNKILFDPILREKLVNNIVNFVQEHKFNGIELQSLYLAQENAVASDKQNFVLLLKALKEKFDKKGLILSLTVDARESTAKKYDIKGVSQYVSFINLRTYNFDRNDPYENNKIVKAAHIAPLYHSPEENTQKQKLNVDYMVKYWLSHHAQSSKLILGITSMAQDYNLADPKKFGRDAPVVEDPMGDISIASYYTTCPKEKDRKWTTFWDKEQQVPYIHKGKEMTVYDNVDSIKMKAEYAKSKKLGGVFIDSIEEDDFDGHCGGKKFPLLRAVNQVLRGKC